MYQEKIDKHFFISHATEDEIIARQIKAELEGKGFSIWLAESDIKNGQRWDQEIEQGIKQSTALLYLVSPASRTSPYVHDELMLALDYQCPIKLIWIGGEVWSKSVKIGFGLYHYIDMRQNCYRRNLPLLIKDLVEIQTKQELEQNLYYENPIDVNSLQEIDGWIKEGTEQKPFRSGKVESVPLSLLEETGGPILPRPPYKGLYAFMYEDADIFFGRERVIEEMVWQIKNILEEEKQHYQPSRCMLVIGASGSGKSSAVMAGLLPYLQKDRGQNLPEVKRWLFLEPVQPGEHPLNALAQSLASPLLNSEAGTSPFENWSSVELRKKLENPDARGLYELLHKIANRPDEQIVLVIDQFEELFAPTATTDPVQCRHFFNLLIATANEPDNRAIIIVTMRADFYDYILKQPDLYQVVREHKLEIPSMEREELRNIIIKPAHMAHIEIEPELVGDLLSDMRKHADALPLLQFTLSELYYHREGRRMTRRKYEELHGLGGAINQHAEKIYRHLSIEEQQCTRELFTEYFVYLRELLDNVSRPGSSEELTRRRVTKTDLISDPDKMDLRIHTAELFVRERLLTAQRTSGGETTYEISHEALINSWERLRDWIAPNKESLYFLQHFRAQARRWEQEETEKKKSDLLYQGNDLKRLIENHKKQKIISDVERNFFAASLRQHRWQQLRRRGSYGLSIALSVITVVALFLFTGIFSLLRPAPLDPTVVTTISETGPGSLASVIASVPSNTTITFAKGLHGTILLQEQGLVFNTKNLTIHGSTPSAITLSSGKSGRKIHIFSQSDITFENLNFANSYTHGTGFLFNEGTLTLRNCLVQNNTADYNGGGITNYGTLNLFNTTVTRNTDSGNGGGIANQQGVINLENSEISFNHAYNNGGGIFSLGGTMTLHHSQVYDNQADNTYGGGINVLNGMLVIDDNSALHDNKASYFGGGLGVQGSVAIVSDTSIYNNQAGQEGGGVMVGTNTDNGLSSLMTVKNIDVRDNPNAQYFIGQNTVTGLQNQDTNNIGGERIGTGNVVQIASTKNGGTTGNPPAQKPPNLLPNYLGTANITNFCQKKNYSYGGLLPQNPKDTTINITCFSLDSERLQSFSARQVCQETFPQFHNVIDRFANYFDPSSLQCYRDARLLGSIATAQFVNSFCKTHEQAIGLNHNALENAYDWKCQPTTGLPTGFSVADACVYKYKVNVAIDRLTNYYNPEGWDCWAPI